MLKSLIRVLFLCLLLSACVQKTDSSLSIDPANFPTLDFQIEGGKTATNKREINITYTSSRNDVSKISINQGSSCSETNWFDATEAPTVTLTGDDGEKQISMIVKTLYGFKSLCVTKAINLDTAGPRILSSQGPIDQTYSLSDELEFTVNFSEVVTVVGSPKVKIKIGDKERLADYIFLGSGTTVLKFKYIVELQDLDEDGIEVLPDLYVPIGSGIFDGVSNASSGKLNISNLSDVRVYKNQNVEPNSVYIASFDRDEPEGSGEVIRSFVVALSVPQAFDVDVNYVLISTSTGLNPTDHNLPTSGTVKILANQQSAKINFKTFGDAVVTGDKVIGIQLTATSHPEIKSNGRIQGYLTLREDDGAFERWKNLDLGDAHSCGITNSGTLKCWGLNDVGQLGDGTSVDKASPVVIDAGISYSDVSLGGYHTCGITTSGVLKCWGYNLYGRLGDGTTTDKLIPTIIDSGNQYAKISGHGRSTCGILKIGLLKCWGFNDSGQLGDGSTTNRSLPTLIDSGNIYTQVSAGLSHTCGITNQGILKCWGKNQFGQIGDGSTSNRLTPTQIDPENKYVQISAGISHTCGITTVGILRCWGLNDYGQLGDGTTTTRLVPTTVDVGINYQQVSARGEFPLSHRAFSHTCGITITGILKCWGQNWLGKLGDGSIYNKYLPVKIDPGVSYSLIGVGGNHSCGITKLGLMKCWGHNQFGQLGDGKSSRILSPVEVNSGKLFKQVALGDGQACSLSTDGALDCWGFNANGQVGDGTIADRFTPIRVEPGIAYEQVSMGWHHACGITKSGNIKCWGNNLYGQVGDGTQINRLFPTVVVDPGTSYIQIDTGGFHSCGITSDAILKCWGANLDGQLGDGTLTSKSQPVIIDSENRYQSVDSGYAHTCGITLGGVLKCWGWNGFGQLGDTTKIRRILPTEIDAGVRYKKVSAMSDNFNMSSPSSYTCGITTDGILKCWGWNGHAQLGDGTYVDKLSPVAIDSNVRYAQISTGFDHACGITEARTLKCWGRNDRGAVGDGTIIDKTVPVEINVGVGFAQVSSGGNFSCAVTIGGVLKCWGFNSTGQLGNSSRNYFLPWPVSP